MLINIVIITLSNAKLNERDALFNITITNCCDVKLFSVLSGVYKLKKKAFSCIDVYCNMDDGGGWIVSHTEKQEG